MKIPPKYLAYGAVLTIGAVALAFHQIAPPSTAAAATPAASTAAVLATAAEAYAPLDAGLAPLADRLAQINARQSHAAAPRDVFAVNRPVWGLEADAPLVPEPQAWNSTTGLILTAVMPNQGEGVALINGKVVRRGDFLEGGYVVQAIKPNSVVLDLDGQTVTLSMQRPGVLGRP